MLTACLQIFAFSKVFIIDMAVNKNCDAVIKDNENQINTFKA